MSSAIKTLIATAAFCLSLFSGPGFAHEASSSYLYWQDSAPKQLRLDIALSDLMSNTFLRADASGKLHWQTLLEAEAQLAKVIEANVSTLQSTGRCASKAALEGLTEYDNTTFSVWQLEWDCPAHSIHYQLFSRDDALHRALVTTQRDNTEQLGVLSPSNPQLDLASPASLTDILWQFILQGVLHMWLGLDHVLFLLTLLMLAFSPGRGTDGEPENKPVRQLILVITSFTIAHSITLVMSSLSLIQMSSRTVETLIAVSIIVSALKVLRPYNPINTLAISFGFGLLHGLGFSGVLSELLTQTPSKLVALFGFNVGVELGQLCIVLAAFPLLLRLQKSPVLMTRVFQGSAVGVALMGTFWAADRSGILAIVLSLKSVVN